MNGTFQRSSDEADARFFSERAAGFAAFVIPAALGVTAATAEPYWLDSGELTAAAQTLGMPHPPGHPLYVMLAKVFTLIPLGGIAFRVSIASAVFGALASFLLYRICFRVLAVATRTLPVWVLSLVALAAAVSVAVQPACWFQFVRQEIYSLQMLLFLSAVYPAVLYCLRQGATDERLLSWSAFSIGLMFANQPTAAAATLPAFLPILTGLSRRVGGLSVVRKSIGLIAVGLFAMSPYLLLPLRASSGAAISLGGVHSPSDFFFVVTATAYRASSAAQYASGFGTPPLETMWAFLKDLGPVIILGFALGVFLLLRTPRTRSVGVFIALSAVIPAVLRIATSSDPFPADYRAYFTGTVAMCGLGFAVFAGVTIQTFMFRVSSGRNLSYIFIGAMVLFPLWKARDAASSVNLSTFTASRLFTDFCFEDTAPGTLVLPSDFNLFFNLVSGFYIEGDHPEISVVNPMLLSYPGYLNRTLATLPSLAPLARSMLVHGKLVESALAEAALESPVRVEPSLALDDAAIRYLLPDGPLYLAAPQPSAESDAEAAQLENDERMKHFYDLLGSEWQESETRLVLLNIHYRDAVYSARRGDKEGAIRSLDAALALRPNLSLMRDFKSALAQEGEVDIRAYLNVSAAPLP